MKSARRPQHTHIVNLRFFNFKLEWLDRHAHKDTTSPTSIYNPPSVTPVFYSVLLRTHIGYPLYNRKIQNVILTCHMARSSFCLWWGNSQLVSHCACKYVAVLRRTPGEGRGVGVATIFARNMFRTHSLSTQTTNSKHQILCAYYACQL